MTDSRTFLATTRRRLLGAMLPLAFVLPLTVQAQSRDLKAGTSMAQECTTRGAVS